MFFRGANRLSSELVIDRNERMMSRKGTRGALAMHQQALWLAVHHVLFLLGDVKISVLETIHLDVEEDVLVELCLEVGEQLGQLVVGREGHLVHESLVRRVRVGAEAYRLVLRR